MSGISGLSALLTISLVALVTMQVLKGQVEIFENYGENIPYTYIDTPNDGPPENRVNLSVRKLSDQPAHTLNDFGVGEMFRAPYVDPNNPFSGVSTAYQVYQADIAAATPNQHQLNAIGAQTAFLPGPTTNESMGPTQQQRELSPCAMNMNTNATVASSLLPYTFDNEENFQEGFNSGSDCKKNSLLLNQVFLADRMGLNTIAGSLRNANQSIRSEPPNPMLKVGPWNHSTIYPDITRRPLEGPPPQFGMYGVGQNNVSSATPISGSLR